MFLYSGCGCLISHLIGKYDLSLILCIVCGYMSYVFYIWYYVHLVVLFGHLVAKLTPIPTPFHTSLLNVTHPSPPSRDPCLHLFPKWRPTIHRCCLSMALSSLGVTFFPWCHHATPYPFVPPFTSVTHLSLPTPDPCPHLFLEWRLIIPCKNSSMTLTGLVVLFCVRWYHAIVYLFFPLFTNVLSPIRWSLSATPPKVKTNDWPQHFLSVVDQSCCQLFSMMSSRHPYPFLPFFTNFTHLRALSPGPCPKMKTSESPLQFIYGTFQSCHFFQIISLHHPLPPSVHRCYAPESASTWPFPAPFPVVKTTDSLQQFIHDTYQFCCHLFCIVI